jgi:integrase
MVSIIERIMGTVTKRVSADGRVRYRAQVRIRTDKVNFSDSKTFSKKSLATEWIKKRELEIEANPKIIETGEIKYPTLNDAICRYLNEAENFGRTMQAGLRFLTSFPIGKKKLDKLTRKDFAEHVMLRKRGIGNVAPIHASTALHELQHISSLYNHAIFVWGYDLDKKELKMAIAGLKKSRIIAKSSKRDRLPTADELQKLTNFFYERWIASDTKIPMYLIMWFAIYTCRREKEITELKLINFNQSSMDWLVENIKHPNGSIGNDKNFHVTEQAFRVINELMKPEIKKRMCIENTDLLIPFDAKTIGTYFRRACKLLAIDDLRFHDLRHEGATRLAEQGLNIPQIQQITLHESWSSLQRYVNLSKRTDILDFENALKISKEVI